ncbi:unnamed protein product [Phytophthora fragariaefolia]|uniref:Unnamed protein product n=1 Tax=Phytophthora fragariaefolia TaxID=1490495 RepID=A0A9W6XK93_9STRA|nr:unnamed protein product [Phytophthora fragariaefolia]
MEVSCVRGSAVGSEATQELSDTLRVYTMASPRNDDELEMNWSAEAVDASDGESVVSAGSEDEFEEEAELELAAGVKRGREEAEHDVEMDAEVPKKQKTEVRQ